MISSAARYGVKAMLDIAKNAGEARVTTSQISERQGIPRVFLTKIIERLVRARLLISRRGAHGGLALARPVREITLLEIIETIDGPINSQICILRPEECVCNRSCPIYEMGNALQNNITKLLGKHTLDSILCGRKPAKEKSRGKVNELQELMDCYEIPGNYCG